MSLIDAVKTHCFFLVIFPMHALKTQGKATYRQSSSELSSRASGHLPRPWHFVFGLLSGDRDGKYQPIAG